MSEEKKLTDEEIVNDLQFFSNLEIEEAKKQGAEKAVLLATLTLDLIHRLQEKIADYEQKLEDGELVSKDWHDEQVLHDKAEIERLTKWKDKLQDTKDELEQQLIDTGFKEYCEEKKRLTEEKAELQKQVDELKNKFEREYAGFMVRQAKAIHDAHERGVEETKYEYEREIVEKRKVLIDLDQYTEDIENLRKETWHDAYSKGKQQTVKETAKEILTLIKNGVELNSMIDGDAKIAIMNELRWAGQRNGVEVE